jgi:hypothetical protein
MEFQSVIDHKSAPLDQIIDWMHELDVPQDLIERMRTTLRVHFAAGVREVRVWTPNADLNGVRNFFVVEASAANQARLELYLY